MSDQIYPSRIIKFHYLIFRVKAVKAILTEFFYVGFVAGDKRTDLAGLKLRTVCYEAHKAHWPYDDVKSFENCFIFIQKGGKIMHPTTPSSKFREILERHNARCDEDEKLPLVKFHALRHSCASLLIEKGVDILTVSK
ncbi:MAG: tyrosine-type recombinase/integrase, partial [Ruminococcus sp.]|nr:tyrosine-type recombinase/integrase [Ruminococcus sp.]